ncbi:glycosyltransferase family 2 protein [Adhaeribacter swui]|uniref:Glycosyltransferase family 2 protein n=1 Tax=Adhaeribacter swui TaxID=2086471 RepID=A0A7G7GFH3_9BACT|nr:glycosyltransferase family 2 protein [Adhaeribacter swui]
MVILNWNGQKFLAQFLPSVIKYSDGCAIYVVDNQSTDNSLLFLKEHFPEIKLIVHPQNLGFCAGYNEALRQIKVDYYVLLNSDVEVTSGWVTPVISLMEAQPAIAACQPKIKSYYQPTFFEYAGAGGGLLDRYGYPFCRGRLFQTLEEDHNQYNDVVPVFWASGACLFVRATAYQQTDGLETAFFAHMEEIDLCWRLQNIGYQVMYCGQSTVFHVGGGTLPATNPRKTFLNFRNGLALLYKNLGSSNFYLILMARLLLDWIAALKFLLGGQPADFRAVLKAHWAVWQNRKYWQQKRAEQKQTKAKNLSGYYKGSIVWDYFVRQKRSYPELEKNKF